ncbi:MULTISPECIES: hypothetical protein [Bacillus]|nr:hypothetical protein [Bacillus pseudomycoides]MED1597859.1 hypothetical protein [Bacillus pseudomycoides]MED4714551.1 hypothetical protein [Bacillus pseudomycoides]OOR47181.1 hypothetical protein BLX05_30475 [Bacillus pseudomycoides]PDY08486.1 hypothetical protein COO16_29615 [Bacillus pseudomycoides]PFY12297.1 hypothetical protein COL42_24125 [Bacillus pseudomycoides]
MNIKEQVKQEEVKEALYKYALKTAGKPIERFPEGNMHEKQRGVEPGITRIAIPSVTSAMDWGQGDITIDVHHDTGKVRVYEQEIDGENWSKSSLRLTGEKQLSDVVKNLIKQRAIERQRMDETANQKMEYQVEQSSQPQEPLIEKNQAVLIPKEIPKEAYKESYKEQVLEEIAPSQEENEYKQQYKAEVLAMLGRETEKEPHSNRQASKEKSNEKQPVQQEERYTKSREERVKEMKEFEKTHSYPEVYRLKKEALQELKGMNLTDSQREKLSSIEKALDQEKQEYDKNSKKESSQEKEPKSQNKFAQLFHQFKNVKKKEQPKEAEMEHSR